MPKEPDWLKKNEDDLRRHYPKVFKQEPWWRPIVLTLFGFVAAVVLFALFLKLHEQNPESGPLFSLLAFFVGGVVGVSVETTRWKRAHPDLEEPPPD